MKRLSLALAAALAALTVGGGMAAGQTISPVPCSDARGCPDLFVFPGGYGLNQWVIVDRTFSSTDCAVVEGATQDGDRRLLLFSSVTPNLGPGDLIIGAPADHPEWFSPSICHRHMHFRDYADYRLWTPSGYQAWQALRQQFPDALPGDLLVAYPKIARQMVAGAKLGFCVIDIIPGVPGLAPPGPPKYLSCSTNQGISVGWADEYFLLLDEQWIDITDVAPGDYVLEDEVNPERLFIEVNYSNNASAIRVTIPGRPGKSG